MSKLSRAAATLLTASVFAAALLCGAHSPASASGKKLRERAQTALRAGDYEGAEKLYREMVSKDARDPEARLGLSHALLKQRKNQDAYDQAARVLSLDPLSARAHALLGAALLNAGDFRLSVEEFRTALGFNGDEAIAVAGLAMVDFYESRPQQSLAGLRRAAFLDSNEPDYLYNLGQVAARYEQYKEAANAYEQFLRIAPRTDADRRARIRGLIDFLRYLGAQGNLLNVSGPSRAEVPFEIVNSRPVLNVRVNGGKDTLRFVIDTGAGMCVISDAAARRLNLKEVARGGAARAVGGLGRFDIVYGFLQSLHIGEAKVERVPVYIREFYNEQEPVDGYIGLSVLSKYLAVIDYGARALKLLRGEAEREVPAQVAGAFEFPIRTTSSGFWSAEVNLDGLERPTNFIIDTGASISVVSEALYTRSGMERYAQPSRIKVFGAAGLAENIRTLLLPRISLGTYVRQHVYAAVLDMDPINETAGFEQTGIVGGNVLRHYRVTFDFSRGVIRLEPLGKAVPAEDRKAPAAVTSQS